MKTIHLVSFFNRHTGECDPIRAFQYFSSACLYIAECKAEAARIAKLDDGSDDCPEWLDACDAFEAKHGFLSFQSENLSCRTVEFVAE